MTPQTPLTPQLPPLKPGIRILTFPFDSLNDPLTPIPIETRVLVSEKPPSQSVIPIKYQKVEQLNPVSHKVEKMENYQPYAKVPKKCFGHEDITLEKQNELIRENLLEYYVEISTNTDKSQLLEKVPQFHDINGENYKSYRDKEFELLKLDFNNTGYGKKLCDKCDGDTILSRSNSASNGDKRLVPKHTGIKGDNNETLVPVYHPPRPKEWWDKHQYLLEPTIGDRVKGYVNQEYVL